jgi:hypothetical protein
MGKHQASSKSSFTVGKLAGAMLAAGAVLFAAPAATAFADPLGDLGKTLNGTVDGANHVLRGDVEGFNGVLRGDTEGFNGVLRGDTEGFNGVLRGDTEGFNGVLRNNVENANRMLQGLFFHP